MNDPNFFRTVILLCEHGDEGTVGFVMNRRVELSVGSLFPDSVMASLPVYQGGPVQLDTLCILQRTKTSHTGHEIVPGMFWGSAFQTIEEEVATGKKGLSDVQFYVGYSGWRAGQLEAELQSGCWLVADASLPLIFDTPREDLWRTVLGLMGDEYKNLANLPPSPQLN